ncbi:malto-oligosyltrehalose synthase [Microcoleus sp. FACHB-672]|uniref:malto-oligosyltrehalose synthase n=1 Tax=Microcoleus sp. FACHB-672 TaxID=2692825 RepID=UPI0016840AF5|nr:malto-oligosyltrehalose synthase [Microcoleus sp. FACHB-672]MBD2041278.1 malto-oligosyltrehalose synthase [Microcoleus sp. FACHB-672]
MRIPTTTYRIQFHAGFNFDSAKQIVSYLAELGISDLYASPIFKAREGSTHGYDVVDPNQLNPELGTQENFEALVKEIQAHSMGWVQDIVPNHMAYDSQNVMLMDVLENGADSDYFDYFDIAWNAPYGDNPEGVLAPLLGNFYNECLENGEIQLNYDQTGLSVNYYSLKLPIRIESYARFLTYHLGKLGKSLGRHHPDFVKLLGVLYIIKNIPAEAKGRERYDQLTFVKALLWELYENQPEFKTFVDGNLTTFNGEAGNPESFNLLDSLLVDQFYRLSFWKVGAEEMNYRRFFTVNELISMRVENPKVFYKTHSLITQLVEEGKFTGLRIDHIDGLYDPAQYLERLREKAGDSYITVEKILEPQEELPTNWPIQGTSGYDFLNYVNGIFCQTENEEKFSEIYTRFTGIRTPYEQLVLEKKALILDKNLAGDADNLAKLLKKIAEQSRYGRDFTVYGLKTALLEVLKAFPIYRTYIDSQGINETDRACIQEVIEKAKEQVPILLKELNFIEKFLSLDYEDFLTEEQKAQRLYFVMRLQQMTGPLMAKGFEDTFLYVYSRLLSLNEVGGAPIHFGIPLEKFHELNQQDQKNWPHKMNATATHDTKRGEDVRARLNVLSEIPDEWEQQVRTWSDMNRSKKTRAKRRMIPDANDEYFFYQTLVGTFPFDGVVDSEYIERMKNYVIKAVKEAKVHTAWLRPDSEYEAAYMAFVDSVLDSANENQFIKEFLPFQKLVAHYGIFNSLAQTLLKGTSPGVPDFYQGTEFWDLSHVDPDNRRPVNFEHRVSVLREIKDQVQKDPRKLTEDLIANKEDGRIKLFLIAQLLEARKQNRELFLEGDYQPLEVTGKFKDHIVAFARSYGGKTAITITPRFLTGLIQPDEYPLGEQVWADTQIKLPTGTPSSWKDAISSHSIQGNGRLSIGEILQHYPVALLIS